MYMRSVISLALLGALSSFAAAQCTTVVTHSGANFQSNFTGYAEAGLVDGEAAAASFVIPASAFPIKLNLTEMIFATSNATVLTTTVWEVFGYEGTPTNGTLAFSYAADDIMLPYLRLGPGTQGTNIQFSVDPGDPEQIILQNNGSNTVTIGYRVLQHNNPPTPPNAPDSNTNAFPTIDSNGISQISRNWLYAVDVGSPLQAPPGWSNFQSLPFWVRPSGDWNIRFTYESTNPVSITDDPDSVSVALGQPATFSVVAQGANLQYQWYQGATPVQNVSGRIFGAQTPDLIFLTTQPQDAGNYTCVVSATCGVVTSDPATLSFSSGLPTISGQVNLDDFVGAPGGRPFLLRFRNVGGTTDIATVAGTLNPNGTYSVNKPGALGNGNYQVNLDIQHWLRDKLASVAVNSNGATNVNFNPVNGDADDSGEVDAADIDAVIADFGGSGVMTDMDGSLEVDAADIDIVIANFGSTDE